MTNQAKILVDSKEAASMLSIGKSTFYKYVKEGKAPTPIKIAGAVRWRVADLQAFFAPQASQPTSP